MIRFILTSCFLSVVVGCAASSGVIKLSSDTYKITTTATLSGGGEAAANGAAYREAQATCTSQGKEMRLVAEQNDAQMTGASVNVTFRCVTTGTK